MLRSLANLTRYVRSGLAAGATGLVAAGALIGASTASASPVAILLIPVAAIVGAVLIASPSAAFLLTAGVVPVERLGRLSGDNAMYTISLMRIVGTVAIASYLLRAIVQHQRLHFGTAFYLYTLYFVLALTGLAHSSHMLGTVRACGAILGNLMFFWLAANVGRSPKLSRQAIVTWLIATAGAGIYTVITWHFGAVVSDVDLADTSSRFSTVLTDTSEWEALDTVARATGPTSHSAVYGMNLILAIPLYFYFAKCATARHMKLLSLVGLVIALYNILLTNTRAVILVAALVVVICGLRGLYRVRASGIIAVMVLGMAIMPLVPDAIWTRVLDTSNYSSDRSATLRIRYEYWDAGLRVIQKNWLAGVGVGNQREIPKNLKVDSAPETTVHNEFIMTALEVGIFGWMLFFGFVFLVLRAVWIGQRLVAGTSVETELKPDFFCAVAIAMFATLLFGMQVDVFHFPLKGWWLMAGLTWGLYELMRQEPRPINTYVSTSRFRSEPLLTQTLP